MVPRPMVPPARPAPRRSRALSAAAGAALLLPLAACSGDAVRTLAVETMGGPKPVAAPDFVAESRGRTAPEYMPVGVDAPRRPARAKSAEGQRALEAELEGARGRNEARGRAAESAGQGTGKAKGAAKPAPQP